MKNVKLNEAQREVVHNLKGIYAVDAGAGTGKTLTLIRRYIHIVETGESTPQKTLMVTFTNNAAEEMKERVLKNTDYNPIDIHQSPFTTFHGLCHKILLRHGYGAPKFLGLEDRITDNLKLLENEELEKEEFSRFFSRFKDRNPQYQNFYPLVRSTDNLLHLIKSLAAKGIFPRKRGWHANGEKYLNGDIQQFEKTIQKLNAPRKGKRGPRQSILRQRLTNYKQRLHHPRAPSSEELRPENSNRVDRKLLDEAFREDTEALKTFVHDLFFSYIQYSLQRNFTNFNFLLMFAFLLLFHVDELRHNIGFDYVMIDEFQDTNEIQFKLALLLCSKGNICVVGDWKQSIYSFQYASVKNILNFQTRLKKYARELNENRSSPRITYSVSPINFVSLTKNYRSSQQILDFSSQSLVLPGKKSENISRTEIQSKITPLQADKKIEDLTRVEVFTSDKEKEALLFKIQEVVDNPRFKIIDEGRLRKPIYSDIAVLSRTSNFGLELQDVAEKYNMPLTYEGGVELFSTKPALLLLAWLRVIESHNSRRGWAVILENEGYTVDEAKFILDNEDFPPAMVDFRRRLRQQNDITAVMREVFAKYSLQDNYASKIVEVLTQAFQTSYMTRENLIRFIERNHANRVTYEVGPGGNKDSTLVQTIHGAKGLEYPIVFIAGINQAHFPSTTRSYSNIFYDEVLGLRQSKVYREQPQKYSYNNWKVDLLKSCRPPTYDEERRLMYVATTRAEHYLFLSAQSGKESQFFKSLDWEKKKIDKSPKKIKGVKSPWPNRPLNIVDEGELTSLSPVILNASDLIDPQNIPRPQSGRGTDFGQLVHNFAQKYVRKEGKVTSDIENDDAKNIIGLVDKLREEGGELIAEEECLLPFTFEGRKFLVRGVIDLIHRRDSTVKLIDYKTNIEKSAAKEFTKQLSVYYHVLQEVFSDKKIQTYIFFTWDSTLQRVEPLSFKKLSRLIGTEYKLRSERQ